MEKARVEESQQVKYYKVYSKDDILKYHIIKRLLRKDALKKKGQKQTLNEQENPSNRRPDRDK